MPLEIGVGLEKAFRKASFSQREVYLPGIWRNGRSYNLNGTLIYIAIIAKGQTRDSAGGTRQHQRGCSLRRNYLGIRSENCRGVRLIQSDGGLIFGVFDAMFARMRGAVAPMLMARMGCMSIPVRRYASTRTPPRAMMVDIIQNHRYLAYSGRPV